MVPRCRREILLLLMAGAVPLSFATWHTLLNAAVNVVLAPRLGRPIARVGERAALVFLSGAGMAVASLGLVLNVPRHPAPGHEVVVGRRGRALAPAPATGVAMGPL